MKFNAWKKDIIKDEDFRYLLVNPVFAKLLGKKREDFASKSGQKKLLNRLAPELFEKFVQVVETGEPLEQELGWETDTKKKWYDLIAVNFWRWLFNYRAREVRKKNS